MFKIMTNMLASRFGLHAEAVRKTIYICMGILAWLGFLWYNTQWAMMLLIGVMCCILACLVVFLIYMGAKDMMT